MHSCADCGGTGLRRRAFDEPRTRWKHLSRKRSSFCDIAVLFDRDRGAQGDASMGRQALGLRFGLVESGEQCPVVGAFAIAEKEPWPADSSGPRSDAGVDCLPCPLRLMQDDG